MKSGQLYECAREFYRWERQFPDVNMVFWESCYRNGTGRLLDSYTARVTNRYRKAGIRFRSTAGRQPDDFAGTQCLYAAVLYKAIELNEDRVFTFPVFELNTFLRDHLIWLMEKMAESIKIPCGENAGSVDKRLKFLEECGKVFRETADELEKCINEQPPCGRDENDSGVMQAAEILWEQYEILEECGVYTAPAEKLSKTTIRGSGCWNNCGSSCLREAVTDGENVLKVRSVAEADVERRLSLCLRGQYGPETFLNADRIRYPLIRTGKRGSGEFRRASWEEALDLIEKEHRRIRNLYGPGASYVNYSTGVRAAFRPDMLIRRLLALDGGYLDFYNDYSAACITYVTELMYGTAKTGTSASDVLNTELLILWGNNPLETGFGPLKRKYIARAKQKGIKIIAIDPRCSDSALYAHEWVALKPGTDGALAAAMAYVILTEGLCDLDFLHGHCIGFDRETMPEAYRSEESVEEYLLGSRDGCPKTPEWAETITGINRITITRLAREYGQARTAAIWQGDGPQRHANGEQTSRMIMLLPCMTGNVGVSGGGVGGCDEFLKYPGISLPAVSNPYPGKIPCYLWTKAVADAAGMRVREDGLLGVDRLSTGIRMIWNLAGNTLLNQHGDIGNTARILEDVTLCECIVCSDIFMTPSARYADVVLPAASCFESEDIMGSWQEGDFLLRNAMVTEPLFASRQEFDWITELAGRLGHGKEFSQGYTGKCEWQKDLYEKLVCEENGLPPYNKFITEGVAWYRKRPDTIAFSGQRENPEENRYPTCTGKIELFCPYIYHMYEETEISPIPKYMPLCENIPESGNGMVFQLIGWHTKRRTHSVHDSNKKLEEREPQSVWIHPDDARTTGVNDGERVRMENQNGAMDIPVKVTGRIMKGVLALSQGGWYTPDKEGTDQRGSINVLTSLQPTVLAKGNPQHTIFVRIRKEGEIPS